MEVGSFCVVQLNGFVTWTWSSDMKLVVVLKYVNCMLWNVIIYVMFLTFHSNPCDKWQTSSLVLHKFMLGRLCAVFPHLHFAVCYVSSCCTRHNAINALISAGCVFIKQPLISVDTGLWFTCLHDHIYNVCFEWVHCKMLLQPTSVWQKYWCGWKTFVFLTALLNMWMQDNYPRWCSCHFNDVTSIMTAKLQCSIVCICM